jgi:hypothetical protein
VGAAAGGAASPFIGVRGVMLASALIVAGALLLFARGPGVGQAGT